MAHQVQAVHKERRTSERTTETRPGRWRALFTRWRIRLASTFAAIVVLGTCLVAKQFWGPGDLQAGPSGNQLAAAPRGSSDRARATQTTRRSPSSQAGATSQTVPVRTVSASNLQVVAIVNGEQITRQALAQECLRRFGKEVVESLVNKHLILAACERKGVKISEQEIQAEIDSIARRFGLSTDRWLTLLQAERNVSPAQYRNDIIWPTIALRKLAADQLSVSEEEFKQAWESEYGRKVQVRVIASSDPRKAEQLRELALENPEEFGNLAKDHSEDKTSAAARGLIPPVRKHLGDPNVEKTVFAMKPGEISQLVQAAGQYFVFKCEKHLPATYVDPLYERTAKERIIERIEDRKMRTAAASLFSDLQQQAKVVNVLNDPKLSRQMPGVAATINGNKVYTSELAEECLQRHGIEVLDGEINRVLLEQALAKKKFNVTEADIKAEVARAADSYGYVHADGSPDIDTWIKTVTEEEDVTVDLYVRDAVWPSCALKKLVGNDITITDDDLRKGFEANYGERVQVLAIVLSSQRRAHEVWEMARSNPTDAYFGELAHQYSIEPISKANFGKVPPIRRFGGQPLIEEEAFALQAGELSGIIKSLDKFVILRCLGRTEPVVSSITEVRDELVKDLREKKLRSEMGRVFDDLRGRARIENFLAGTRASGQRPTVLPASAEQPQRRSAGRGPSSQSRPRRTAAGAPVVTPDQYRHQRR